MCVCVCVPVLTGHLIASCRALIKPYIGTILEILMPKLRASPAAVPSCVMSTIGTLATVGGRDFLNCMDELVGHIAKTVQENSGPNKKEVAIRTLGQVRLRSAR